MILYIVDSRFKTNVKPKQGVSVKSQSSLPTIYAVNSKAVCISNDHMQPRV